MGEDITEKGERQKEESGDSPHTFQPPGSPFTQFIERIKSMSAGDPPGSKCGKCGRSWDGEPWCSYCSRECWQEYEPIYAAFVCEHREVYLERARVPFAFQRCGLDSFGAHTPHQVRALDAVKAWAPAKGTLGIFLHGPVGTGKTHLAVGALLEKLAKGRSGSFVSARELLLKCRESFRGRHNTPLSVILKDSTDTNTLMLDDLCAEKTSEFAREVFDLLIDRVYSRRRPQLIVTSNLDLSQLGQRLDERISDRIRELCLAVKVSGPSYRRRIAAQRETGQGGRGNQIS